MERVQAGQHELFGELVLRYRDPLMRVALSRLGNAAWAEDVVQEAFLAAFTARDSYRPAFAFRTWLWTILLNLCRRQWKRSQTRPAELPFIPAERSGAKRAADPVQQETALTAILQAERVERLEAELSRLPEPQADALRLRFFGGLQYDEIAHTMGSSLSAAKVRVRNGLLTLAQRLQDDEDEGVAS